MSDNEAEFFGRLIVALPECYIFPQVAMTALLEATSTDKKKAHSDRLRIAQQRIDYVICDRQCRVIAVVELDDRTHSRVKDQVRDSRLEQAGVRVVRFQSKTKPSKDELRNAVLLADGILSVPLFAESKDHTTSKEFQNRALDASSGVIFDAKAEPERKS